MSRTGQFKHRKVDGGYSEDDHFPDWTFLPESILLRIFSYLNVAYIPVISLVCRTWNRISSDEFLWKQFFLKDFQIKRNKKISPEMDSWASEYRRLVDEIPIVESECLEEHNHQVLHVSFSHDGTMFATSSKDGYIMVWKSSYPAEVVHYRDMKFYSWKYTQFSQFNKSDTLLLVSGVHFGSSSTSGEIAVFNLENDFLMQCRVLNKPYDIFGTWYNDEYLLSGELRWLGEMVSANVIWLNKATQELQSERQAIISRMYQFYNVNASSIRTILVADCQNCLEKEDNVTEPSHIKEHGNPPSVPLVQDTLNNHSFVPGSSLQPKESSPDRGIIYEEYFCETDKYLIFTTGSKTYSPHQIGIKRIHNFKIPTIIDAGPGIRERLLQRDAENELRSQGALHRPDWLNYESVKDKFDKIDHIFELHGHIIGMCLSPDQRFLFVNSRPWPIHYTIDNPLDPPVIAQEIDIHVFDLLNLTEVGVLLRSHRAYTPNAECFFIFLDASEDYVASGAEDKNGYIWERHYNVCLAKVPHRDVVNSVAFNPKDPEMLVTVSDDHKIKVWRSRRRARELLIPISKDKLGQELRIKRVRDMENSLQLTS